MDCSLDRAVALFCQDNPGSPGRRGLPINSHLSNAGTVWGKPPRRMIARGAIPNSCVHRWRRVAMTTAPMPYPLRQATLGQVQALRQQVEVDWVRADAAAARLRWVRLRCERTDDRIAPHCTPIHPPPAQIAAPSPLAPRNQSPLHISPSASTATAGTAAPLLPPQTAAPLLPPRNVASLPSPRTAAPLLPPRTILWRVNNIVYNVYHHHRRAHTSRRSGSHLPPRPAQPKPHAPGEQQAPPSQLLCLPITIICETVSPPPRFFRFIT